MTQARMHASQQSGARAKPGTVRDDKRTSAVGARPSGRLSDVEGRREPQIWVGREGDRWEREADRAALRVAMGQKVGALTPVDGGVQRKAAEGGGDSAQVTPAMADAVRGLEGSGRPLPAAQQTHYARLFGRSMSDVRLHTGPSADSLARKFGAAALTVGRNVVMGEGTYRSAGRDAGPVFAHELAHIGQNKTIGMSSSQPREKTDILKVQCGKYKILNLLMEFGFGIEFAAMMTKMKTKPSGQNWEFSPNTDQINSDDFSNAMENLLKQHGQNTFDLAEKYYQYISTNDDDDEKKHTTLWYIDIELCRHAEYMNTWTIEDFWIEKSRKMPTLSDVESIKATLEYLEAHKSEYNYESVKSWLEDKLLEAEIIELEDEANMHAEYAQSMHAE